ncbi:rod shape-determining protein MreD [Thermaurantiacus sp.]
MSLTPRPVRTFALVAVPLASLLGGALVAALPLPLATGALPNLPLILLIAWASLAPRLLPPWSLFLVGLVQDAIAGLPLGVMALVLPVIRIAIRFGEDRMMLRDLRSGWLAAAALVMLAAALELVALAIASRAAAPAALLLQAGLTILCYPPALAFVAALAERLARA